MEKSAQPAESTPEITVAIVSYNTREHLRACLRSVYAEAASEIVVVDNASTDGSAEMVELEFPTVVLFKNQGNPGYGASANQAIAGSIAPYILLLNSDTILRPGTLRALSRYLDQNPTAAIAAPRLSNIDGTLQRSCYPYPTPVDVILDLSNVYRLVRFVPGLRERALRTWSHSGQRMVPWTTGAAWAIRREAYVTVGGFDKSFFMYYEEVDLCFRLAKAGWQVHFAPVADVTHVGGASTRQRPAEMTVQLYASLAQFYRRHYPKTRLVELAVLMEGIAFGRLVRDAVSLRLARNSWERAILRENINAWQSLLLGEWRKPTVRSQPPRTGRRSRR